MKIAAFLPSLRGAPSPGIGSTLVASVVRCAALLGAAARRASALALVLPAFALADTCPPEPTPPTPSQIQELARQARDRGALWRITKDGRHAWLYGTVHVGQVDWAFPGPQVTAALRESEVIALELDPADPQTAQAPVTLAARLPRAALSPSLLERLAAQRKRACQDHEALQSLHPVLQVMLLQLLAAREVGLDPAFAQEGMLAGFAQAAGRKVVALESAALQLEAVIPPDLDDQRALIDSSLAQLESGRMPALIARMGALWERGDVDALGDYLAWCECAPTERERRYWQRLNDERNPGMAQRIDALHREGRRLFIGVGALHMSGPAALPKLLAERGWQVERVPFKR